MFAHRMETDFIDIITGVLQMDTQASHLLIICRVYVHQTPTNLMALHWKRKEAGDTLHKL